MNQRNGALDVLRALAIILVVNCHAVSTFISGNSLSVMQLGGKGVDLFFVLSGWLLGSQLCNELKQYKKIDIPRFWVRRWMRTLPAYYVVLAFTFLQQTMFSHDPIIDLRFVLFTQNYPPPMPYFGVSWSLCVEEHFYLMIAPCLLLAYKYRSMKWILLALLTAPTFFRTVGWYHTTMETHVRYDQCASGVLLAATSVFSSTIWNWLSRSAWPAVFLAAAMVSYNMLARMNFIDGRDLGMLAWTFVFSSLVLFAVTSLKSMDHRSLSVFRYLASRSYAVYLLHIESLAIVKRLPELPFLVSLLLTWTISLIIAELLHRIVEQPFMNARELFSWSRTMRQAKSQINQSKVAQSNTQEIVEKPHLPLP